MGQKVNPVGFRLGINRGWDSVWYAKKKDFGNYFARPKKNQMYLHRSSDIVKVDHHNGVKSYL